MLELITLSLSTYAVTFVIASSSLFEPLRTRIIRITPRLKIGNHRHFIECRMCVSAWVALAICNTDWKLILPVYGLAYFFATQERK